MAHTIPQISILPSARVKSGVTTIADFQIEFKFLALRGGIRRAAQKGCCWHSLFQNPVIVGGYPISPRRHNEKGLEISLQLMADLGHADYLTDFAGNRVLKGFSTMFVETESRGFSTFWHFLCNLNGERMPYSNALKYCSNKLTSPSPEFPGEFAYRDLITPRNFVGWASSVKRLAGKSKEQSSLSQ